MVHVFHLFVCLSVSLYLSIHVSVCSSVFVCVLMRSITLYVYFSYQEIWCFCPNHSFTYTHPFILTWPSKHFASRNWLHFQAGLLSASITLIRSWLWFDSSHFQLKSTHCLSLLLSLYSIRCIWSEYINHFHSIFNGCTFLFIQSLSGSFMPIFSIQYVCMCLRLIAPLFWEMCLAIANAIYVNVTKTWLIMKSDGLFYACRTSLKSFNCFVCLIVSLLS